MNLFRFSSSVASIKKFAEKPLAGPKKEEDFSLPRPHAIHMNETSAEVISYKVPNRPLIPLFELPIEARYRLFPSYESPPDSKLVNVAIIGAPNSGKTSLLNSMLGERYFSVSRKVNTTISTHKELTNSITSKG